MERRAHYTQLSIGALAAAGVMLTLSVDARSPFSEEDAVSLTSLGDPEYWDRGVSAGRVAKASPDGSNKCAFRNGTTYGAVSRSSRSTVPTS
jgi:hypothetical protein